ncbi:MAG: Gfo/Idh/MocA family protein, partial [Gammaproteobacteria bacterium]
TFTELDAAIAKTGAVAVTIATPPHTHAPLALTAIARGCHVICEKPFAMNVAEARTVLDAARRAGVTHLIGHQFRWMPDRALLARSIADGLIGEPRFASFVQYMPLVASPEAKMPRWWFDPQAGGGWLGAHGSHLIDQIRSTLGEFQSVSATLALVSARDAGVDDSYLVHFQLANGLKGVLQSTAGAWGGYVAMTRVAGTRGTVWVEGGTVKLVDKEGTRDLPVPAELALPPASDAGNQDPRQRASSEVGPYVRLCEALRAGVDGRAAASPVPLPTFADGLACMEVLDAIHASAANGGALVTLR